MAETVMTKSVPANLKLPLRIAAITLLLGIPPIWPYGYYMLLRLIVCAVAAYCAYMLRNQSQKMLWLMVIIALLFNPIALVALPKIIWIPIDFAVAITFFRMAKRASTYGTQQ